MRLFIALMMEAVRTSETSVYTNETTRRYTRIPESCHPYPSRLENLTDEAILLKRLNSNVIYSQQHKRPFTLETFQNKLFLGRQTLGVQKTKIPHSVLTTYAEQTGVMVTLWNYIQVVPSSNLWQITDMLRGFIHSCKPMLE
jgi:hypothetical protein